MKIALELEAIRPSTSPSPMHDFEQVREFGLFSLPFVSGHIPAQRVLPRNDSAPFFFSLMNALSRAILDRLWPTVFLARTFERIGGRLFDLGAITMSSQMPNEQFSTLMLGRVFPVKSSWGQIEEVDLGHTTRAQLNTF